MKIKHLKWILPLMLVFLLASCVGVRVTTDYDHSVDFAKYKTYNFSQEINKIKISDINRRRLKNDIGAQLEARGYQMSETPDILVNVFVKGTTKYTANAYTSGFGGPWGFYRWGLGSSNTWVNVDRYTEGTMFIDLIDVQKKELIWEGIAQGMINPRTNTTAQDLNDIVTRVFKEFPR